jgi:protein-S-isoprenylcysteine O-methyltransferase Ste14
LKYLRILSFFAYTLVIYVGLPLLGWGLDDIPGFFALPVRVAYAVFFAVAGLAAGYQSTIVPGGVGGSKGAEGKLVRRQSLLRVLLVLSLFGGLALLSFADRRSIAVLPEVSAARWLGLGLVVLGGGLAFGSVLALGRLYSADVTIQQDHRLMTTGPYHYLRHPRYLGVLVATVGISLVFRSWLGLGASVLLLGILLVRIRDEEALLQKEFGEEWAAYRRRSWRLLPFVY